MNSVGKAELKQKCLELLDAIGKLEDEVESHNAMIEAKQSLEDVFEFYHGRIEWRKQGKTIVK